MDDGSRIRNISLGIRQIEASDRPDLGAGCTTSDRHRPLDTRVNGPPMARSQVTLDTAGLAPGFTMTILTDAPGPDADLSVNGGSVDI